MLRQLPGQLRTVTWAGPVERKSPHRINGRIGAELSWSRTEDRSARTRPAREKFLQRFERQVDPDGKLPSACETGTWGMSSSVMLRTSPRGVPARSVFKRLIRRTPVGCDVRFPW